MNKIVKCETCLYNKNCQFLGTHKNAVVEGCTAYKNAADVVEVVRCKDCQYKSEWANDGSYPDYNFCKHSGLWCVTDSHFCSEGKRKGGAEE